MKGHIRERSPGKWAIILDIRDPETGKRKRKWHSFTGAKRAAQIECARYVSAMAGGAYQEPAKTTVAQYLERWVAHMASQVAPRTHERYAEIALKNVVPLLGAVPLTRLRPEQIKCGVYEGARQRSPRWRRWPLPAHRTPHAPYSKTGARRSRALAPAHEQSGRSH